MFGMASKLFLGLVAVSGVIVAYFMTQHMWQTVELPPIIDGYFGPGQPHNDDLKISKFSVAVPDIELDDLKKRLEQTKFFEPLENANFHYGVNTNFLRKVKRHWLDTYDWRKHETTLNQFSHYRTEIEGLNVHFIRVKPKQGAKVFPLLLVHGWPGSVWEFYKMIPLLTDPLPAFFSGSKDSGFAFEVIVPSIPGYAWSDKPKKQGFGFVDAARVMAKLMDRLGFHQYYCQGGDWGAGITSVMSQMYPERVLGVHLNFAQTPFDRAAYGAQVLLGAIFPGLSVSPEDHDKVYPLSRRFADALQESGYFHIQATKPDTVGFALQDSPLGLAAYILEKFSSWTNLAYRDFEDGGLSRHWSLDELLTNVMIYWTTDSIVSSQRFYKEAFASPHRHVYTRAPITVPTGVAVCPHELVRTPRNHLAYKYRNITSYTNLHRCGHFAAFEEPKLLAADVFRFVEGLQ